jgi:hypothetical protein
MTTVRRRRFDLIALHGVVDHLPGARLTMAGSMRGAARMAYRERRPGRERRVERGCFVAGLRRGAARGVVAGFALEPEFEIAGTLPL